MSQHIHRIYTASYDFLQVYSFLLILMSSGVREDSSGFVKETRGKAEKEELFRRREKRHVNPRAPLS